LVRFFGQFEPVKGDILKSPGLKGLDVPLDGFELFPRKYAGLIEAHKKITALFDPYIRIFVLYDEKFHFLGLLRGES
jgi:hypothetical protein